MDNWHSVLLDFITGEEIMHKIQRKHLLKSV